MLICSGTPCDAAGDAITSHVTTGNEPNAEDPWMPYRSQLEFELAEFLFTTTRMPQVQIKRLLELWASSLAPHGGQPPFASVNDLLNTIDATAVGDSPWMSSKVRYNGILPDDPPSWMNEEFDVWYRDPLTVIKSILSNPDFAPDFDTTPYREYLGNVRRWGDFMSGTWAWEEAVSYSACLLACFHRLTLIVGDYLRGSCNAWVHACAGHSGLR